jgi:CheY-like chemotaxis protein
LAGPTILIAEDELLVRMATAEALRAAGYTVLEAHNGDRARELISQHPEIALVFSDVMMPGGLDGIGLASWIRDHHPHIRIILASGVIKLGQLPRTELNDIPVLDKPYMEDDLVDLVKSLLAMG